MIINIRGTSGSGKSTLVRGVISKATSKARFMRPGRKQPLGYVLGFDGATSLFIPGHYETACGGCDTINGLDDIYGLVQEAADLGNNVLFEGLIVCSDYKRLVRLKEEGYPVRVIGLTTPIDLCVDSVRQRRLARGNEKELNPKNTEAKHKTNVSVLRRFEEAGVAVSYLSRDDALALTLKELGIG